MCYEDSDTAPRPDQGGEQEDSCWICLSEGTADSPLLSPCECPRKVHEQCSARWQLHCAGKSEERTCRFCNATLRDWKEVMAASVGPVKPCPAHVRIVFNGKAHRLQVRPGPDGAREFERQVRLLLNLPANYEFEVTFHLKAPGTGDRLQLQGLSSYDAAVHCASLSAATKAHRGDGRRGSSGSRNSSGGGGGAGSSGSVRGADALDALRGGGRAARSRSASSASDATTASASSASSSGGGERAPIARALSLRGSNLLQRMLGSGGGGGGDGDNQQQPRPSGRTPLATIIGGWLQRKGRPAAAAALAAAP